MSRHRHPRNPLRWVPVLTLAGLAFAGGASASAAYSAPPQALSAPVSAPAPVAVQKPPPVVIAPQRASQPVRHTVKAGENLWTIAAKFCGTGTADAALAKANHIASWVISPGETLIIAC